MTQLVARMLDFFVALLFMLEISNYFNGPKKLFSDLYTAKFQQNRSLCV